VNSGSGRLWESHGLDLFEENTLQSVCRAGGRSPSLQVETPCKHSADSSCAICVLCPRVCVPFAKQNNAGGIPSSCSANKSAIGPLPVDYRAVSALWEL
jgi:hypothetical protein